jgi:chromosome segregation ATPase
MRNVLRAVLEASERAKAEARATSERAKAEVRATTEKLDASQQLAEEQQQAGRALEQRVNELVMQLENERRQTELARFQAKELYERLNAAEAAFQSLWGDASAVLAQVQGSPEELAFLESEEKGAAETEAAILAQLPGEDVDLAQRFAASVTLAAKVQQLRAKESEQAATEIAVLRARCARHEAHLEATDRSQQIVQSSQCGQGCKRDVLVAKIATCLAHGYTVKEGTQSEVRLLRRQLDECNLAKPLQ